MKHLTFTALLFILLSSASAQTRDTLYYSSDEEAAKGFRKVRTKYRDEDGRQYPVVYNPANLATYYVAYTCRRGYFRVLLDKGTTASAD